MQTQKRDYTRHCFVVTRAAVQFWKFARFDPYKGRAKLPHDQLACAHPRRDGARRLETPSAFCAGSGSSFPATPVSAKSAPPIRSLFQANIGLGWPVYFRAGNMPIVAPVYRETEERLNHEIFHDLTELNVPTIVWLYNFPSLNINHVVVVISCTVEFNHYHYLVLRSQLHQWAKAPRL